MELSFKMYLTLILLNISRAWAISYSNTGCPSFLQFSTNLKTFQEFCYQFVPVEKDWFSARDYCQKYDGKLVSIPDSKTNEFLKNVINSMWWRNNGIWIGLNDLDVDGQFTWTSRSGGTRLGSWTNWGSGHPGAFLSSHRDCIRMARDGGLWMWHETPCNFPGYKYRFICQYETVKPIYTSTRPYLVNAISSPQTVKPSLQTISAVITPDYVTDVQYEEPRAYFQKIQNLVKEGNINNDSDSKATQVVLVCLACLLILALSVAIFMYRRRQSLLSGHDNDLERNFVKNSHLENACAAKVENIYIDESMQKFLKSKESEKQESIYEEIPYDANKVEVVHV